MRSDGLCGRRIVLFRAQAGQNRTLEVTLKDRDGDDFGNMFQAVESLEKKIGINTSEGRHEIKLPKLEKFLRRLLSPTSNTMQR